MDEKEAEARPVMGTIFLVWSDMQACSISMKSPDVNLQLLLYNYLIGHGTFIIK